MIAQSSSKENKQIDASLQLFAIPECVICHGLLEKNLATIVACGHIFHSACLVQNQMYRRECPQCKQTYVNGVTFSYTQGTINLYFEAQKRQRFVISSKESLKIDQVKFLITQKDRKDHNQHVQNRHTGSEELKIYRSRINYLEEELNAARQANQNLEIEIDQNLQHIDNIEEELDQKIRQLQNIQVKIFTLQTTVQINDSDLMKMRQMIAKLKKQKDAVEEEYRRKFKVIESEQIMKLKKEMDELKAEMNSIQSKNVQLEKQNLQFSIQLIKLRKGQKTQYSKIKNEKKFLSEKSNPIKDHIQAQNSVTIHKTQINKISLNKDNPQNLVNFFFNTIKQNQKDSNLMVLKKSGKYCPEQLQQKDQRHTYQLSQMKKKITKDPKQVQDQKIKPVPVDSNLWKNFLKQKNKN